MFHQWPLGRRVSLRRFCHARQTGAKMFFWFLVAVGAVVGLTLLGAFMTRRSGGWDHEDGGPMGPWVDH